MTKKRQQDSAQDSAQDSDGGWILSATSSKPTESSKPSRHKGPSNKTRTALSNVCCLSLFFSYRIRHNADMPLHCSKQDVFKSRPASFECSLFTFCIVDYLGMCSPTEIQRAGARPSRRPVLFTILTDYETRDHRLLPCATRFDLFSSSKNEAEFTYLADRFLESILLLPAAHPERSFVSTKGQKMGPQGGQLLT